MPTVNGTSGSDGLQGTSGPDDIHGFGGDDFLEGFEGDDLLDGGDGEDWMAGGPGNDRYLIDVTSDAPIEGEGEGDDSLHTSVSYWLAEGVSLETMTTMNASGTTPLDLTGNAFGQSIYGNAGSNIINGRGGIDYLVGLGGNDRYFVDDPLDGIAEAAGEGDDWLSTSVNYALAAGVSIELINTTNALAVTPIELRGNDFGQSMYGNAGDNMLIGLGGADYLVGLGGDDILIDGEGADYLAGGDGADLFVFSERDFGNVIVDFQTGIDMIELGLLLPVDFFEWLGTGEFTGNFLGEARYVDGVLYVDTNRDLVADLTVIINAPVGPGDFSTNGLPGGAGAWDY